MSNITPIRAPMPQWGGPPMNDGWMWDGNQWVWCGPQPCPPPQQCGPPPQQCGPPSCNSAIAKAQACYDQSQSLYNLVSQVVSDIFAKNPGIIPAPPPSAGSGPIIGVTDGSSAAPGQVGEFIEGNYVIPYTAYPNGANTTVSTLIVQPGDWDLWASMGFSTAIGPVAFYLNPIPTGMSNGLTGYFGTVQGMSIGTEDIVLNGQIGRGSFTVPTLLAFSVQIDQDADSTLPAGSADFQVSGRRRR